MSAELSLLKSRVIEQTTIYQHCDTSVLPKWRRLLVQAWLSEVGLLLERLQRDVVQLEEGTPSQVGLRQAWSRYWQVFTALSPVAQPARTDAGAQGDPVLGGLRLVASRLSIVFLFLLAQLAVAVALIFFAVRLFAGFDPQTALTSQQWQARGPARAQIRRVTTSMNDAQAQATAAAASAAAATPPPNPGAAAQAAPQATDAVPDVTVVRAEVESLSASLPALGLATIDLRTANVWLDTALVALDKDPPGYGEGATALQELDRLLTSNQEKAPPSIIIITVLGSLLGMITITIHLNWKFRNRWDTVGFLPWYITKLIAAPIISLCAVGLMSQVTFTKDLSTSTGFSNLGLLGASPLLMFSVAILTGLFSNRVFDWLRSVADSTTASARTTTTTTTNTTPVAAGDDADANG
jgi:hypothetical protein